MSKHSENSSSIKIPILKENLKINIYTVVSVCYCGLPEENMMGKTDLHDASSFKTCSGIKYLTHLES